MSDEGHKARTAPRLLEVRATRLVSPHMQRVTLGGSDLEGFPAGRKGAHIKLFLPLADQTEPVMPTLGPDGPSWPPADQCPITRTYSIRSFDAHANTLDVDFVLHGDEGPASAWAARARAGDRIGLAGPGGPEPMVGTGDWYLFAGDLSALPAISALLETLPADARGYAVIEVPGADDRQPVDHPAGIEVQWLVRDGEPSRLVDTVKALPWPDSARPFAWIAGENADVIALRRYLRGERGLTRESLYTVPYWKARASEEVYHEERHEVMDAMEAD